jgi:hypothetical protein
MLFKILACVQDSCKKESGPDGKINLYLNLTDCCGMLRFIARRQVDRLASLGYSILTGIELEFMLLHQVHCLF